MIQVTLTLDEVKQVMRGIDVTVRSSGSQQPVSISLNIPEIRDGKKILAVYGKHVLDCELIQARKKQGKTA